MNCPFCHHWLKNYVDYCHIRYFCENIECMMSGEMPRFIKVYSRDYPLEDGYLIKLEFCIDSHYIKINYEEGITYIYKFNLILLEDTIKLNFLVDFDFTDIQKLKEKIILMVVYS